MRVAEYVAKALADHGIKHVFMLVGGGAMHLNDAIAKERRIQYICNHHEQACAMAAEGYARTRGSLGAVCVTTGPGGTNALTGVLGQWLDSIPVIYISGQVRRDMTVASTGLPLRQLGDQEADIVSLVKPITKYAVTVNDPLMIRYHLDRAISLACSGRPGPVWLDLPLDVQASLVDEQNLTPYEPLEGSPDSEEQLVDKQVASILQRISVAERPVILAGAGIRLAGAEALFQSVVDELGVPVLVAWDAIDILHSSHPLCFGRPSTLGQRAANFIFQNADLLLVIGCRMNTRQIGYSFRSVARAAYKIVVDIDQDELRKQTFTPDLPIRRDAGFFLTRLQRMLAACPLPKKEDWLGWCRTRCTRYPPRETSGQPEQRGVVDPYLFCEVLSNALGDDDVVVSANGAACVIPIQVLRIKKGQRHIVNSGCAAMGYGLPAAIGASFARDKKRVICLEGDGSIQLNIQELQTVVHHQLPLKIFVFNNGGYLSIRNTQQHYFSGHLVGEGPSSGVSFPDIARVAEAYGIRSVRLLDSSNLLECIKEVLETPGPVVCDVHMPTEQSFVPRVTSERLPDGRMVSKPLEDMCPFLDREEFLSNMIIAPWAAGGTASADRTTPLETGGRA